MIGKGGVGQWPGSHGDRQGWTAARRGIANIAVPAGAHNQIPSQGSDLNEYFRLNLALDVVMTILDDHGIFCWSWRTIDEW
jgi:hypothetical protein